MHLHSHIALGHTQYSVTAIIILSVNYLPQLFGDPSLLTARLILLSLLLNDLSLAPDLCLPHHRQQVKQALSTSTTLSVVLSKFSVLVVCFGVKLLLVIV